MSQSAKQSTIKDMTTGSPAKLILGFAIPMLMGLLFQQFYSMVDTIIVGKFLGVDALASVGSTAAINFMINGFVIGVCTGFSIPVAQRFGAQDYKNMRRFVANAGWLASFFAVVMTVIVCLLTRQILVWMQTPDNIIDGAYSYIFFVFAGIPATIDNDIAGTDYCLGVDTAQNVILDCIDSVRDTARSHHRAFVIETMGRDCGYLAMTTALCSAADICIVPEIPYDLESIYKRLQPVINEEGSCIIAVVAEGTRVAQYLTRWLTERAGMDTRLTVLGHVQRGGSPTLRDRSRAAVLREPGYHQPLSGAELLAVSAVTEPAFSRPCRHVPAAWADLF